MITLIPRMTEKAYAASLKGTYVFRIPLTANKAQVIAAVESEYAGVKVRDVRLLVQNGKVVRAYRGKRRNPGSAPRNDTKKAYVTLSEGSIEIFKEAEEDKK